MANDRLSHTDLASRRRHAGASREAMAAGLGLRLEDIQEIEEGRASQEVANQYGQWLDRIESWPSEKRAQDVTAGPFSGKPAAPSNRRGEPLAEAQRCANIGGRARYHCRLER